MHAKHDYNPVKTAYPIDSIPEFDEGEYPAVPENVQSADSSAVPYPLEAGMVDAVQSEEDLALLGKQQQTAFHQSRNYQGAQAYHDQGYTPTSTELESKISWGLLIGCTVLFILALLIGGIFSLVLLY
jgi:hypothetical protein